MSEEHRLDGPSLRLGRRGKLFRHDGKEQRDVAPLARATTPGPSAHAHAHAHAHFNAHAHAHAHFSASTQGAGTAPTGSPALNGDPVPAFGDQVISTWRELRDLVQLRDIAIETTAAVEFEDTLKTVKNEDAGLAKAHNAYVSNIAKQKLSKNVYAYERLPLQPPPGMQETREEVRELHRKQNRLRGDEFRQKEIIRQVAANNPTDMLRRLGIDAAEPLALLYRPWTCRAAVVLRPVPGKRSLRDLLRAGELHRMPAAERDAVAAAILKGVRRLHAAFFEGR